MASTFRSGEFTSDSTRSMSWIIRSSTTPMSVERKLNEPQRDGFDVAGRG